MLDVERWTSDVSATAPKPAREEPALLKKTRALSGFYPATEHFRHAPGLRDATAGHVRLARVEDLADRAEAVITEMDRERVEKFPCALFILRMNLQPRVDER